MDHVPPFSLGFCRHFFNFYRESPSENIRRWDVPFVVVPSFSWFSSKDSHEFPPRSGGWGAHRVNTVDGPKRGGPWIRWLLLLLNLIISLINNYCWARWTAYPPSRLDSVDISTTFIENPPARTSPAGTCLLLLCPLFRDSRLRILMNSL